MPATIEKWKKIVGNGGVFGALLTDLSEAFDCIPHDLIIAKLEAYGFHMDALKLIHDYLSNRKQRLEVNDTYSSLKDIFYGVPIYTVSEKKESVISALQTCSSLLFGWFNNNFMKANSDKSHLIRRCAEATTGMTDGLPIDSSKTEVLQ